MTNQKAITAIVNLLALTFNPHYQELLLIDDINEFFKIDQNIFVSESATKMDRFVDKLHDENQEPTPRSIFTFESLNTNSILANFKGINDRNTFLIVSCNRSRFIQNSDLFRQIKEIQRLNINMRIGVFFPHIQPDDLKRLFEWCWTNRIVNIFVAFHEKSLYLHQQDNRLNVFRYSPFGSFDVINVTSDESVENYFPAKVSNFKGFPIRLGIYEDIWLFQYSKNNRKFGGPDGKLWKAILEHLNASFTITVNGDHEQLWQMLKNNSIDVVPFLHRFPEQQLTYLYPMNMETEVIAVPGAQPFPEFIAYLRSITSANFFGYSTVTILTVVLLLIAIRHIKLKKYLIFQCAADVVNLLMNDNGLIRYRELSRSEGFLIVSLTFTGIVIVNGILSSLQSYVTRPIMQSEIDTVEDIYKSPFPIFTVSKYWLAELPNVLGNMSGHGDWTKKVCFSKNADLLPQIFRYNTTMSVLLFKTHVNILLEHQKRLNIRGYHIPTEIYILKFLSSYHVSSDFPFIERFNDINQRLQSAGLYQKWTEELYDEVKGDVFSPNRSDYMGTNAEAEIDSFPMPTFIFYGWIMGFIVLIFEIIWTFGEKRL